MHLSKKDSSDVLNLFELNKKKLNCKAEDTRRIICANLDLLDTSRILRKFSNFVSKLSRKFPVLEAC